ncbi:MAG: phosphoribosyltransferase [Anaerolineae bacterium]|nr:phosphoribosyltransferase [Anaerolineae bacterium]
MRKFRDRAEAGQALAARLRGYRGRPDVIVLGIPRGGVVVAEQIARALEAPLDVFVTRKIGAPVNEELAIGAVASDGSVLLDHNLIRQLHLSEREVERQRQAQMREIERRMALFRQNRAPPDLENKTVILVDDGIATGATVIVALRALRAMRPRRIVLAVPVAPGAIVSQLRAECDELVLLGAPEPFLAVGYFFEDFTQVTDQEVVNILRA